MRRRWEVVGDDGGRHTRRGLARAASVGGLYCVVALILAGCGASPSQMDVRTAGVMPDVVCMNLQDAQDLIQEHGVFYSRSKDATGAGRMQLVDSNWQVVSQQPAPGTRFGEGDAVLSVVKYGEQPNSCDEINPVAASVTTAVASRPSASTSAPNAVSTTAPPTSTRRTTAAATSAPPATSNTTTTAKSPVPPPTTAAQPPPPPQDTPDPRFETCKKAKAAGYGPYYEGQDPEYYWYRDADGDGIVCE